jgi:hypothetical protein
MEPTLPISGTTAHAAVSHESADERATVQASPHPSHMPEPDEDGLSTSTLWTHAWVLAIAAAVVPGAF